MIELLKRSQDGTVEHIAKAIRWQHHNVRSGTSCAFKKWASLSSPPVPARSAPKKTGPKDSTTVYRITGSSRRIGSGSETGSPPATG